MDWQQVCLLGMTPSFASGILSYYIDVPLAVDDVTVNATMNDATNTLTIVSPLPAMPAVQSTDTAAIALGLGSNTVQVRVDRGGVEQIYTVTIVRGAALAQQAYFKASNTGVGDLFGNAVALSGDTLAVGAFGEDSNATGVDGDQTDNAGTNSGAVYVFTRAAGVWTQQAYLEVSNTDAGDRFGRALALSGNTLAAGAASEESSATGVGGNQGDNTASSGAAYGFVIP